jgi:hypothetical protein
MVVGCEGEQGLTGPSGADGTDGTDGNANVKTGTISPTNEEWLWSSFYWFQTAPGETIGYMTRYVDIPVAEITPDIISAGVVLVFFEAYPGTGNWTPLPFQFVALNREYIYNIVYEVMEGMVRLHYFNMPNIAGELLPDLSTVVIPTYTFKYTVIEGTALQAMQAREVDVSDHDQVMEYLASL